MENWKKYSSFLLAFVFAALSSVSVYQYLSGRERVSIAKVDVTAPVVVAKRDITPGVRLTREDLTTQDWPKESVTDQYFTNTKELTGRTLRTSVIAEEPLTAFKLMREGENFTSLIPPDMRGVTITIRKSEALARLLERGSMVDVIALFDDGKNAPTTKVIAQGVHVLAIHERSSPTIHPEQESKQMEVTLMVTPRDAEWIIMAMNKGIMELVLRNEENSSVFQKEIGG